MSRSIDTRFPVPATAPLAHSSEGAFDSVVCGVDGSRGGFDAVRQAAMLARPGATVDLVSVVWERGTGLTAQTALSTGRAEEALGRARDIAGAVDVHISTSLVRAENAPAALLERVRGHELAVVGSHAGSRIEGIVLGSTASALLHRASAPVLVARRPPEGERFGDRILVASDGSADAGRAVEVAAAIAGAYGSELHVVVAAWGIDDRLDAILAATRDALGGIEPRTHVVVADPRAAIVAAAARVRASLVVVGSRGLGGVRALGSVSEVVAHDAPCSALVARHDP